MKKATRKGTARGWGLLETNVERWELQMEKQMGPSPNAEQRAAK